MTTAGLPLGADEVARVFHDEWGRAVGSSKKRAEQLAAANAAFLLAGADLEAMGLSEPG